VKLMYLSTVGSLKVMRTTKNEDVDVGTGKRRRRSRIAACNTDRGMVLFLLWNSEMMSQLASG